MRQSSNTFCFTPSELELNSSVPSFSPGATNNGVTRHRIVPRRFKNKSSQIPSQHPSFTFEKANVDDNSMKAPDEKPETVKTKFTTPSAVTGEMDDNSMKAPDEKPETVKTKFATPSAVTGEIPCHFQGSSYSSKLSSPNRFTFTTGEPIPKEMQVKPEPKSSSRGSTQMVLVSRILKGMPQNPHFLPLKSYSDVAKQRLINAWDNIFEETVDNLLSLQVNGFSADAKRLWETMEELEKMGYHVIRLRRRLVELTDVIIRRRNWRTEITRLKDETEENRLEKSRLEFEIAKLRSKVEAANACVEDIMGKVTKMEDELPHFNDVFTKLAIKLF